MAKGPTPVFAIGDGTQAGTPTPVFAIGDGAQDGTPTPVFAIGDGAQGGNDDTQPDPSGSPIPVFPVSEANPDAGSGEGRSPRLGNLSGRGSGRPPAADNAGPRAPITVGHLPVIPGHTSIIAQDLGPAPGSDFPGSNPFPFFRGVGVQSNPGENSRDNDGVQIGVLPQTPFKISPLPGSKGAGGESGSGENNRGGDDRAGHGGTTGGASKSIDPGADEGDNPADIVR